MSICNLASQIVPYVFSVYKFSVMLWFLSVEFFSFRALISVRFSPFGAGDNETTQIEGGKSPLSNKIYFLIRFITLKVLFFKYNYTKVIQIS